MNALLINETKQGTPQDKYLLPIKPNHVFSMEVPEYIDKCLTRKQISILPQQAIKKISTYYELKEATVNNILKYLHIPPL